MHIYNPSIQEAKAGGLQVQGQSGLHSENLSKQRGEGRKGSVVGTKAASPFALCLPSLASAERMKTHPVAMGVKCPPPNME
jgi:hypothetical protein